MMTPARYLGIMLGLFVGGFAALWAYTINGRELFLDAGYGEWSAKLKMIRRCDIKPNAIIGDSNASAAYVPRLLGLPIKNLALSGTTPVEAYFELQDVFACPRPPETLIVAFSPVSFEEINWLWLHAVSYGALTFVDLQDVAATEARLNQSDLYHPAFGAEPSPMIKNWLYVHHFPPYDFAALLGADFVGRGEENRRVEGETSANDGQHLVGTPLRCAPGPAPETARSTFAPNPVIEDYLRRLLDLTFEHGAKVILSPTPISTMTAKALKPTYLQGFRAFLHRLRQSYPNVHMAGDSLAVLDDCLFGDAHHVNEQGAVVFSQHMAPLLSGAIDEAETAAQHYSH